MRLRPEGLQTIRRTVLAVTAGEGRVCLFGSRLDDQARGGDIDLMVKYDHPVDAPAELSARNAVKVSRAMGGRKVDVLPRAPNLLETSAHRMVLENESRITNGHGFEKTPRSMKAMPVPLTPHPFPVCGRGELREVAARLSR
jgi:predicted nucleotidyltransferase